MTDEARRVAAAQELARADEEIQAAHRLLDVALPRIAMTRVYFAVFHAVRALLYAENIEPRSHRAAATLFSQHFVKTGKASTADGRLMTRLQRYREEADYADGTIIDTEAVDEELHLAETFVVRVKEMVGS